MQTGRKSIGVGDGDGLGGGGVEGLICYPEALDAGGGVFLRKRK